MYRWTRRFLALAFVLAALAVAPQLAGAAAPAPLLRLVYAVPNGPAVDIYVDGQRATQASKFGDVTAYVTVPEGTHRIQVFSSSAGTGGAALLDTQATLQAGLAYTALATDRADQMSVLILTDDLTIQPADLAYVRLVHLSPDAPPVADVAVSGGPVVVANLPFKGATPYLPVAPGSYRFDLRPAGTPLTLATTEPIVLESQRIYSIFVIGQLGDNTFRAVIAADNARSGGVGGVPSTGGGGLAVAATPSLAPVALPGLAALVLLLALAGRAPRRARAWLSPR